MQKKFYTIVLFSITWLQMFSQTFSSATKHEVIDKPSGLDKIFIFKKIESNTLLEYFTASSNVKWYKMKSGILTEISNLKYISPESNTGYVLDVDGVKTSLWVFDYSFYKPTFNSLVANDALSVCEEVKIQLNALIPTFYYENIHGSKLSLDRKFTLKYHNIEWANKQWSQPKEITTSVVLPNLNDIIVSIPLINTHFTIIDDEYAGLNDSETSISTTTEYQTKAVKCNITTETVSRDKDEFKNENNRPDKESLKGSSPLDVYFNSNATVAVNTYLWEIFKKGDQTPFISRTATNNTYSFTEVGKYVVKLRVSNQHCAHTDTVEVEVFESSLVAPKVFTPNGDNVQDEFRVAYQSINEFECTILNRWGRIVYKWNNPAKGWNGKIGNREAAIGPYYYVIKAKGSDGRIYKLTGHVNLIR